MASLSTQTYIIGALHRSSFRRSLLSSQIKFSEDKGWLDSQFVVQASDYQHQVIQQRIREHNHLMAYQTYDFKLSNGDKAEQFYNYACSLVDDLNDIEMKKGWFRTKFEIRCHPVIYKDLTSYLATIQS